MRIIATDMEVPEELAKKVEAAGGGRYSVRRLDDIAGSEKKDVEVLVIMRSAGITRDLFRDLPNVRVLQSMSAGVDFIDFAAIPEGITVCSNAGAYSEPIAEHVFAMVLFFAKNLMRNHERLRQGVYDNSPDGVFLAEKTIAIIGAGGIGRAVARVAKGFRMRTAGINTTGRPVEGFDEVRKMDGLDDLLRRADVVVISIPHTKHTRSLIDAGRLSLMKDDCILVNIARGRIIEQGALYSHLKSHPRFRAGIDVWWRYPKKGERFSLDYPFFDLPNFLASPHNADAVPEAVGHAQEHAFANVMRYIGGGTPERVVDRADYLDLDPGSGVHSSVFRKA
jgi:phosphoglycerate dehydrogenase-like enzyme